MRRWFSLLLVLAGGVSLTMGCGPGKETFEPVPEELFHPVDLTESEEAKLDPLLKQLLAALALEAESARGVEELSEVISIHQGEGTASVDVFIKTTDKAKELGDLGIHIQARIGDIVTANVPTDRLPEVVRLPSVIYIEAARLRP
jgi:hypothetical protein